MAARAPREFLFASVNPQALASAKNLLDRMTVSVYFSITLSNKLRLVEKDDLLPNRQTDAMKYRECTGGVVFSSVRLPG